MSEPADTPQYPQVTITYTVQYLTKRDPDTWYDANATPFTSLPAATDYAEMLITGEEKPRGNSKAYVTGTQIAQTVSTTTIILGDGAPTEGAA